MKATLGRLRAPSLPGNAQSSRHLTSVPPPLSSTEYSLPLANLAARVLYRSPLPSRADLPVYILNAAAFPDSKEVDYDQLLPYVLARLPGEDELIGGSGYEVVFFAGGTGSENVRNRKGSAAGITPGAGDGSSDANGGGGGSSSSTANSGKNKKSRPGWGWFLQAYQVLTRAMRKRLMKLYVVHEKGWIRVVMEMFATIVSPKVRKKVVHVSTLSALAFHIPIEDLLIPPTAYVIDRSRVPHIFSPYASGRRAFGAKTALPTSASSTPRLPRVLREATNFVLTDPLMKTEGLFRVSARAQTVEVLKEAFERGQKFIVWRDGETLLAFPHYKEGSGIVAIDDLEPLDGYDVHTAAALIKMWYHDLREPILPMSGYQAMEKIYGGKPEMSKDDLYHLLSPNEDDFSPFPPISRRIMTFHLLPMLSRIVAHSDRNRMTAANLATVFAPNLVCGSDQMADLKMIAILQKLLIVFIEEWKSVLAPLLGANDEDFEASLRLPELFADREDPLEEARKKGAEKGDDISREITDQISGISMLDNEHESENEADDEDLIDDDGNPPPLPPRPTASESTDDLLNSGGISPVRRKPAPAVVALPRYSMVVGDRATDFSGFQQQNTSGGHHVPLGSTEEVDHENNDAEDLPSYEQSTPHREDAPLTALTTSSSSMLMRQDSEPIDSPSSIQRKPVASGKGGKN